MAKTPKPTRKVEQSTDITTEKLDKSPYVPQRDKFKGDISLRDLDWTDNQKEFFRLATDKDTRLMLIKGDAGTAKTFLSIYTSLKLLNEKKVSDIIYLRSAVESSDAHLGFLPGSAEEKMAMYNMPFWDKVEEILSGADKKKLIDDKRVHCLPINFIRGLNWNAKAIILDEAQNSTKKELVTALTRLGKFSRCFICADPKQTDLNGRAGGGFDAIYKRFKDNPTAQAHGIHTFELTDNMRSELVAYIAKELENL